MGPIVIQTERLLLREWTVEDAAHFMTLASDVEIVRYINGGIACSLDDVREFIERQVTTQRDRGWCRWAIQLRAPVQDEPAGVVGLCGPGCTFAPDVEVGWWMHRELWGRGLATEAGRAAVDYCFGTIGFPRLICCVHPENTRSLSVARNVGFVPHDVIEHKGMRLIRHQLLNPLSEPPREPRFVRDCAS